MTPMFVAEALADEFRKHKPDPKRLSAAVTMLRRHVPGICVNIYLGDKVADSRPLRCREDMSNARELVRDMRFSCAERPRPQIAADIVFGEHRVYLY